MSIPNRITQKGQFLSTRNIQRAVWIVFAVLIVTVVLFAGYYYWDRYVGQLGDKSPLELGIEKLEGSIHEDPQNPQTRVALAELYLNQGRYKEALDQTGQVLQANPEDQSALLLSGIALIRLNQPEAALEPLQQFVAARKDEEMAHADTTLETAYYYLGESYLKLNRPAEAVPVLEQAVAINRTDADALYQLGRAYQATGKPEAALEHYQKAVRFVPDFTEAYSGMVESYTALNQPDHVAYAQGMQAFTLKDYKTAQAQLEKATKSRPDFGLAFLGLGLTYEKLGKWDEALTAVQRALELNPDDMAAQQAQGRIQAAKKRQE